MVYNGDYEGKYFIFGINSPHARMVYGEEAMDDSCIVFQKKGDNLIPIGEDSIRWETLGTDNPPRTEDAINLLERLGVTEVFTTAIMEHDKGLWGLINEYAPEDWDYAKDPSPPAEVYFPFSTVNADGYLDHINERIKVNEVEIKPIKNK